VSRKSVAARDRKASNGVKSCRQIKRRVKGARGEEKERGKDVREKKILKGDEKASGAF
jgi:hypothetical protein